MDVTIGEPTKPSPAPRTNPETLHIDEDVEFCLVATTVPSKP